MSEVMNCSVLLIPYPETKPISVGTYLVQKKGCFGLYRNIWDGGRWKYKVPQPIIAFADMPSGFVHLGALSADPEYARMKATQTRQEEMDEARLRDEVKLLRSEVKELRDLRHKMLAVLRD